MWTRASSPTGVRTPTTSTGVTRFLILPSTKAGWEKKVRTRSAGWVLSEFDLPVTNVLDGAAEDDFSSPGALLRARVDRRSPATLGLPDEVAIFHGEARAFATSVPGAEIERQVLAWYPADSRDILLS